MEELLTISRNQFQAQIDYLDLVNVKIGMNLMWEIVCVQID